MVARACGLIGERYDYYTTGWRGPVPPLDDPRLRQDLTAATFLALSHRAGVEGGIWQAEAGPLAYAFPTYQGSGPKTDLPAAERDRIRAINETAVRDDQATSQQWASSRQTLLLQACPLPGPIPQLTAWTMMRVQSSIEAERLRLGLGVLLVLILGMSGWLLWVLASWSRRIGRLEAALAGHPADAPPVLDRTGEPSLDRIVAALNQSGARLGAARRRSDALMAQVASAERLAALGRVAAGVAHEIRNPIAAMRLRAENALATADEERRTQALQAVLDQVARLDRLSGELLAMTQRREPRPVRVELAALLAGYAEEHADQALAAGVTIRTQGNGEASIDPDLTRRALDCLFGNAVRHTPPGGTVTLRAARVGDTMTLHVEDTGPGVDLALRETLFDPFVTGRPEGTGLGLAIARELVGAQGGRLYLDQAGPEGAGAHFVIELPAGGKGTG